MIELLKILLSLSLSGALLILVLLLCKPLYKNRLSRQWQYYIWLVAVARLLLPFTPETSLVGNLFRAVDSAIVQISTNGPADSRLSPETDFAEHDTPPENQADTTALESPELEKTLVQRVLETAAQNVWLICVLVWLMAAVGLLIRKVTIYQSFVKYINAGRMEVADMRLWEQLGKLVEQAGVKRTVELYTNGLISSPLLIGFLHPCIMLPSVELSDSDFKNTILHELTHYKRRDMFYKWLVQGVICFHWFNPLVYFMGREINRACEFSCDEAVIRTFDKGAQRAYGDTLLNAIGAGGNYNDSLASVMLNENAELLKERLETVMRFKKSTRLTMIISAALILVLCFGAAAGGAYATVPHENETIQSVRQAKANGNTTTSDITNSRVIREGEVYYIFCDGADESNKPTGGSVGNIAAFVLVRKDSYTSISGFTSLEKLVDEVTEQCDDMLKKRLITQDEARLIVEVAAKIQSGNDSEFKDYAKETSHIGEYAEWGIEKKNDAYFYKNERLRVFMDLRADGSFVTFDYDKLGTTDLRLVRNQSGNIIKVEYLTKAEADEILGDLETAHSNLPVEDEDTSRLTKAEVPVEVLDVINSCENGKWYIIQGYKYQYIYFDGVPHNYAWQPEIDKDSASIDIYDIDRSNGTYVLLAVPNNLKVTIRYNSKQVAYTTVAGSSNGND